MGVVAIHGESLAVLTKFPEPRIFSWYYQRLLLLFESHYKRNWSAVRQNGLITKNCFLPGEDKLFRQNRGVCRERMSNRDRKVQKAKTQVVVLQGN